MTALDVKPQATEASTGACPGKVDAGFPIRTCATPKELELRTERLVLRGPGRQDATAIARLINDRRIAENTARIPHPYSVADADAFVAQANRDPGELSFLITLASGALVGGCGIKFLAGRDPEPGYWIGVPYWGCGYATEAARALVDHAFTQLGCERLTCRARVSNPASRRVLEKCGFQWTGVSLIRINALQSSAPVDCFRLDRHLWTPSPPSPACGGGREREGRAR